MARLIIGKHIKTGTQTAVNQLTVQAHMVKIAMQNKYCAPIARGISMGVRHAKVMYHNVVLVRRHVALMIRNLRMLYPEVKAIKAAVGHHLFAEFFPLLRIKWLKPSQQGTPIPVRY